MPRRKRSAKRLDVFPNSDGQFWRSAGENGYFCGPRILPILMILASNGTIIKKGLNCAATYVELYTHLFEQGVVLIYSEREHAFLSGFTGQRAVRSWQERIAALEEAGFIQVARDPFKCVTHVLIRHPLLVLEELTAKKLLPEQMDEVVKKQIAKIKMAKPEVEPEEPEPEPEPTPPPPKKKVVKKENAGDGAFEKKMKERAAVKAMMKGG